MTTISGRVVLLLGAVALGCTAAPDRGVTGPNARLDRVDAAFDRVAAASGTQQQVTGFANILLPFFQNAEEKYSNSAIRHADGTVSGQFELKSAQDGGLRIHGDVVCFTIIGNMARLAGQIDQSSTPSIPEGTYVIWTVVDNGEGQNDPPDLTSDFIGPFTGAGAAAFHCSTGINVGPFYPVQSGNLQVHE
jgi:hypothetical protein